MTPERGVRGVRACAWPVWASVEVEEDWVSGVYMGRLSTRPFLHETVASWQSYVIFIVTDDKPADVLFQCSDNTWQAYNGWPEGDSLYTRGSNGTSLHDDYDVSFDRPYGKQAQFESVVCDPQSIGSGEFLSLEYPAVYWLEQQGLSVRYVSNSDLVDVSAGAGCKVMISIGHDEYLLRATQMVIAKLSHCESLRSSENSVRLILNSGGLNERGGAGTGTCASSKACAHCATTV